MSAFRINRRIIGRMTAAVVVLAFVFIVVLAGQKTQRNIPPSAMITTSPQPKMRYLNEVFPGSELEGIKAKILSTHSNTANVFLVDAINERDAITVSAGVLFGSKPTDKAVPVNAADARRGSHWLVAYLGLGPSDPTQFVIENASVEGNRIRLTYRDTEPAESSGDIHHFYFWVPLEALNPGTYFVELHDAGINAVTLSRRIEVTQD